MMDKAAYVALLNEKIMAQWSEMIGRINLEIVRESRAKPQQEAFNQLQQTYRRDVVLYWCDHIDAWDFAGNYNFVGLREMEDDE